MLNRNYLLSTCP